MAARPPKTSIDLDGGTWVATDWKERSMDRYSRRIYFERLCDLRESYARRGPEDSTSVITIEAAIARATRLLNRGGSPLVVMLESGNKSA
jgi:hypothetical protein